MAEVQASDVDMTTMLTFLSFIALIVWALYGIGKVAAIVERAEANVKARSKARPKLARR